MNKQGQPLTDEESPALRGPDYVALVIEWEDLADPYEDTLESMKTAPRPSVRISDDDPRWSRVDEASDESFPASDPPAWGSSHAVACEATAVPDEISAAAPFAWKKWALAGVGALALAGGSILIVRWLRA